MSSGSRRQSGLVIMSEVSSSSSATLRAAGTEHRELAGFERCETKTVPEPAPQRASSAATRLSNCCEVQMDCRQATFCLTGASAHVQSSALSDEHNCQCPHIIIGQPVNEGIRERTRVPRPNHRWTGRQTNAPCARRRSRILGQTSRSKASIGPPLSSNDELITGPDNVRFQGREREITW